MAMHILIVEDDLDLGRSLLQSLRTEGLSGEWQRGGCAQFHPAERLRLRAARSVVT